MASLPPQHQTLLFSATMPVEIEELANKYFHNPVRLKVRPPSPRIPLWLSRLIFISSRLLLLAGMLIGQRLTSLESAEVRKAFLGSLRRRRVCCRGFKKPYCHQFSEISERRRSLWLV